MLNVTLKMSSQGQITIPKDMRDQMGIKGGSEFVVVAKPDKPPVINIYPKPLKWVDTIAGIAQGAWGNDPKASTRYVRELRNEWDKRNI